MTTGDDGDCKRKSKERKDLYFWFNSTYSHKCAALFKLKLTIDGDVIVPKQESLKMLETFFLQYGDKHTEYASCAPYMAVGSSTCKLFLMPNEFDRVFQQQDEFSNPIHQTQPPILPSCLREKPCVYVIDPVLGETYSTTLENPPLAHKVNPIAVTVDNKVYVLSRRNVAQWTLPEPTFEAYDPEKDLWETLPQPWFNHHTRPYIPSPESTQYWDSPGFAVFGHFIIVCSAYRCQRTKFFIHSYNTISKEWKPLQYPSTPLVRYRDNGNIVEDENTNDDDDDDDDDDAYHPSEFLVWDGEAVVVKNFIYAYVSTFETLVSYKCCANNNNNNNTLSFDACIAMERSGFRQVWAEMMHEATFNGMSGAVGKIGDDLICLVKTMLFASLRGSKSQPVHLMIFRLDNQQGGISSILLSCDLVMPGCADFGLADIFSCFVLPPEVASKWEHQDKKCELSYELGADASLVSDVGMKEATGIA